MKNEKTFRPDRIFSYFRVEWLPLAFVTLSGLIYNIGRFCVRRFANNINRRMKGIVNKSSCTLRGLL